MNDSPHFEPVFPSHAIERCGAAITFAWKCRVPAIDFPPNGVYAYRQAGAYQECQEDRRAKMAETSINIIDALRGQEAQLRRLLAQKVLISEATRPQLSEMEAQVMELKRLLNELEKVIQDQLKRGDK
jgi:hypothetical protein